MLKKYSETNRQTEHRSGDASEGSRQCGKPDHTRHHGEGGWPVINVLTCHSLTGPAHNTHATSSE